MLKKIFGSIGKGFDKASRKFLYINSLEIEKSITLDKRSRDLKKQELPHSDSTDQILQ